MQVMDSKKTSPLEKLKFQWVITNEEEKRVDFRLRSGNENIGEFSFIVSGRRKLDPTDVVYSSAIEAPYPPLQAEIDDLRSSNSESLHKFADILEQKPEIIGTIQMWAVNDIARGNLSVARLLIRTALPELRKRGVKYLVGEYVGQAGPGLTPASYARDMYERIARMTDGEVYKNGSVWISVENLARLV